jgi:hypothetical protein
MWEIAGLMGKASTRMIGLVYAKHHPDSKLKAMSARDDAFGIVLFRAG